MSNLNDTLDPLGGDSGSPFDDEAPAGSSAELEAKLKPVAVGTALVLVAVLGVLGAFVTAVGSHGAEIAALEAKARKLDAEKEYALDEFAPRDVPGADVALGVFLVNPVDAAHIRYVRCAITLTVTDVEEYELTGLAQARAKAAVVGILGTRTVQELGLPGGLEAAREQVRRSVRSQFSDDLLLAIHFSEFVVQ